MAQPDLSFLPEELTSSAVVLENGEVMWPRHQAGAVVDAISHSGRTVLGLDLRSDGSGQPPSGLAIEIPWFDNHGANAEQSQVAAQDALARPMAADFVRYSWVLVTWQD